MESDEQEDDLYFYLPRKNCEQIVPELVRLNESRKHEQHKRLKILMKTLRRANSVDERYKIDNFLKHAVNLDLSDRIIPHGNVSKRLYEEICKRRNFDLYGRRMPPMMVDHVEDEKLKSLAEKLGIEYSNPIITDEVKVPNIFGQLTSDLKTHTIKDIAPIAHEDIYHPPVGFAKNPEQPSRSYGNEIYYTYDGEWWKGKMHGNGVYKFSDGGTYDGQFLMNRQHGYGRSVYSNGSEYVGDWESGRYGGGVGVMKCRGGSEYKGEFRMGRREGQGRLEFPSGLVYEGEFFDGKPHGRGKMTSTMNGYAYEGSFFKGSIEGSGVLITPPPESKRITQIWPHSKGEITLPTLVRNYIIDKENEKLRIQDANRELQGPLRSALVSEYLNTVRKRLRDERAREKREKQMAQQKAIKEQKMKLIEARLKALTGKSN